MIRTLPRPGILTPPRGVQRPLWPFAVNRDSRQADGLAAWWPILPAVDPAILRELANGIDGTIHNSPTWDAAAELGWTLDFPGSSSYISGSWSLSLTATPITVSGWFSLATLFGTYHRVCDISDASNSVQLAWDQDSQTLVTKHTAFQGGVSGTQWAPVAASQLYHFAVVWDATGSGTTALYLNGQAQSGASNNNIGAPVAASNYTLAVRRDLLASPNTFLDGSLADIRVYSRALSPAEVAELADPRTRWELCDPVRQRVWSFGTTAAAPVPRKLALPGSVGTARSMSGGVGTAVSLAGSVGTSIHVGGSL